MKKTVIASQKSYEAALEYLKRQARVSHPDGSFDKQHRWYPSAQENCGVSDTIRLPSARWPFSYLHACRSLKHVATLFGADETDMRRAMKDLKDRFSCDDRAGCTRAQEFVESGEVLAMHVAELAQAAPSALPRKM